jgi:hypothetical protein
METLGSVLALDSLQDSGILRFILIVGVALCIVWQMLSFSGSLRSHKAYVRLHVRRNRPGMSVGMSRSSKKTW